MISVCASGYGSWEHSLKLHSGLSEHGILNKARDGSSQTKLTKEKAHLKAGEGDSIVTLLRTAGADSERLAIGGSLAKLPSVGQFCL